MSHIPCETDIATLIAGCHQAAHAQVLRGFCWELFRLAIVEQSTEA